MPDLLYPYLIGFVTTVVVPLLALVAFIISQRRAVSYARREAKLPLATQWENLNFIVEDLEEKKNALRDEVILSTALIDQKEEAEQWLRENGERVADMKAAAAKLELVRDELTQRQEECAKAERRLHELELESEKAKFTFNQAQKLEKEAVERANKIEHQSDTLSDSVAEKESQLADLGRQIAEAQRDCDDAKAKLERKERRYVELCEEIRRLEERLRELQEREKTLSGEINSLTSKEAKLKGEVQGLNGQIEGLVRGNPGLTPRSDALHELWRPAIDVKSLTERPKDQPVTEDQALDNVRAHLVGCGLRFHPRVVKAFHTSLKTTRETPLLVLAGISGTGKSLLPQRYAEAMGMHCVVVPVQPRWDGPQDLLGFYNYLESQYKPTELARALIQMDPINRDWIPQEFERYFADDRMLIVLLDEMNLARVEYYFSEFLSRLENRRMVADIYDASQRQRAEIVLDADVYQSDESGDAQDAQDQQDAIANSECRVYVDTNVLFVGTINEDESTLSLSDKVLDRANVMRFGRPPELESVNGAEINPRPSEHYLSKETWQEWIKVGRTRQVPEDLSHAVSQLNDALGLVGRPFAFRTSQAIHEYIRQYPDQSDEGCRHALADQIELRILPKLRGVDTDEVSGSQAIDKVHSIVHELDDPALVQAIERGRAGFGSRLFAWLGAQRSDDN